MEMPKATHLTDWLSLELIPDNEPNAEELLLKGEKEFVKFFVRVCFKSFVRQQKINNKYRRKKCQPLRLMGIRAAKYD